MSLAQQESILCRHIRVFCDNESYNAKRLKTRMVFVKSDVLGKIVPQGQQNNKFSEEKPTRAKIAPLQKNCILLFHTIPATMIHASPKQLCVLFRQLSDKNLS